MDPAGTATPDCASHDAGATTITIRFRTVVQRYFTDTFPSGDNSVDQGDVLSNTVTADANVLRTSDFTDQGYREDDGSAAQDDIGRGALSKDIYAVNGSTTLPIDIPTGLVLVKPGDDVTYRLTYTLTTSDLENLRLEDYLPLPIFDVDDYSWSFSDAGGIPAAGVVTLGPSDTFYAYMDDGLNTLFTGTLTASLYNTVPTMAPVVTADSDSNFLRIAYANYNDTRHQATTVDLLFTVTVSSAPFADRLYLTNQGRAYEGSTNAGTADATAIVQLLLTEPVVVSNKGIIATDNATAAVVFTPDPPGPVAFNAPGTAGARWAGTIDFDRTGRQPDRQRPLRRGRGRQHHLRHRDREPGLQHPRRLRHHHRRHAAGPVPDSGGRSQSAHRQRRQQFHLHLPSAGRRRAHRRYGPVHHRHPHRRSGSGPGRLPGVGRRARPEHHLIITYDLQLRADVEPGTYTNTSALVNYSGTEGGPTYLPEDDEDDADTTTANPASAKVLDHSELNSVNNTDAEATIGEFVYYRVTITVPEGVVPAAVLQDTLDTGLAYVACDSITASPAVATNHGGGFADACATATVGSGGTVVTYSLGDLTNSDTDNAAAETVEILYHVIVDNALVNTFGAQRNNAAVFSWDSPAQSLTAVSAAQVTILEPALTNVKAAYLNHNGAGFIQRALGDAGDPVRYVITLSHAAGTYDTDAYDVSFSDALPRTAGLVSLIDSPTIVSVTGGVADRDQFRNRPRQSEHLAAADHRHRRFRFSAGQRPGGDHRGRHARDCGRPVHRDHHQLRDGALDQPGRGLRFARQLWHQPHGAYRRRRRPDTYFATGSDYFGTLSANPVKSLLTTSESSSFVSTYLSIGEIARYRLTVLLPEGTTTAYSIRDNLPNYLMFLEDGTARVAFVSNDGDATCATPDGTISSSTLGHPTPWQCGNETTLASITPAYVFAAGDITSNPAGKNWPSDAAYTGGVDPIFNLGVLTNTDNDNDNEYVVIEFNALMVNNTNNQNNGAARANTARVYLAGAAVGANSNTINVYAAEPVLTIVKAVTATPQDAGDAVQYTLTITNTSTGNTRATAFNLIISDAVGPWVNLESVSIIGPAGMTSTDSSTLGANGTVSIAVTDLAPSVDIPGLQKTIVVTVNGHLLNNTPGGFDLINTGTVTYTSLPGAQGTTPNTTGSTTPGVSGAPNGERNGTGGVGTLNDYVASSQTTTNLTRPAIEKMAISPAAYTIGEIVTYTLRITLPEGVTEDMAVTDVLPAGLAYQSYEVITTAAASGGLLTADFDGAFATPSPSATLPGTDGQDLVLAFGDTTVNADGSAGNNRFLVRLTARVLNVFSNQNGDVLPNTGQVAYTNPNSPFDTLTVNSNTVNLTVVEAILNLDKHVLTLPTPADAGGTITYEVVISHNAASAFDASDLHFTDILPAELDLDTGVGQITVTGAGVGVVDNSSGNTVDITIGSLADGGSVTITYHALLLCSIAPDTTYTNTGDLTWTSLPGTPTGERTSGDGLWDNGTGSAVNDYERQDTATFTTNPGTLTKSLEGTSSTITSGSDATIGETATFRVRVYVPEGTTTTLAVTDNLPAGLECVTGSIVVDTTGFDGTLPAGTLTCPAGNGADPTFTWTNVFVTADNDPDDNYFTITFDALVLDVPGNVGYGATPTALNNTASVTINGGTAQNSNTVTVNVVEPHFTVVKTAIPDTAADNDTVTFQIVVTNTGLSQANDIVLDDPLPNARFDTITAGTIPAGFTFSTVPSGADTIVRISGATLPAGESRTFTFTVNVVSLPDGTVFTNTATVTDYSTLPGTVTGERLEPDVSGSDDLTGIAPDIAVIKTSPLATYAPGDTIVYTLQVSNLGEKGAENITVTETVPDNAVFVAAASLPTVWSCADGSAAGATCTTSLASLASLGSANLTFAVRVVNPLPEAVTDITNSASAADDGTHGTDSNPANNADDETDTLLAAPDLAIVKSDGGASTTAGGVIVYTLAYRNNGNQDATGVVISETVPANTTFRTAESAPTVWSCADGSAAGTVCTTTIGHLSGGGGSGTVTFAVRTVNPVPSGVVQISNTATVDDDHANGPDATPGDNTSTDVTPLTAGPDLSILKSDGGATTTAGGTVAYTLIYRNTGDQAASNVLITETVPANTTFNAALSTFGAWSCPDGSVAGTVCTHTVGTLAGGGTTGTVVFALNINASPLPSGFEQVTNTASIDDDHTNGTEPTPADNTSTDTTPVSAAPSVAGVKSAVLVPLGNGTAEPGEVLEYTIRVTNSGDQDASAVVFTDTPDANTTLVVGSVTATAGAIVTGNTAGDTSVRVDVGTLAGSGSTVDITFRVTIHSPLPAGVDDVRNHGTITGGNIPSTDTNTVITPVESAPDLSITKTDGVTQVAAGSVLTYTLTVTNSGNQAASGVVVTDRLPDDTAYQSSSAGGVYSPGPRTVVWSGFGMAAGEVRSFTVTVRVDSPLPPSVNSILNEADVTDDGTNGPDATPGDNDTSDMDVVGTGGKALVDDSLADTVTPAVAIGEILTYETQLVIGPDTLVQNLVLTDRLDRGLAFVRCESITSTGGSLTYTPAQLDSICDAATFSLYPAASANPADAGRQAVFDFGDVSNLDLSESTVLIVDYSVVVLDSAENVRGMSLRNQAFWTWTGGRVDLTTSAVTIVEPALSILKVADLDTVIPGNIVTYTITINHTGLSDEDAYDLLLEDIIPAELQYVPGSLRVVSGQDPGPANVDDSAAPTLRVRWPDFQRGMAPTVIEFQAEVLPVVVPGMHIVNTAALSWSSIPGNATTARSTHNALSTERYYSPGSAIDSYGEESQATINTPSLPNTGFAPGRRTVLPPMPPDAYNLLGTMTLSIPQLNLRTGIVGVPMRAGQWDLSWLGNQAGYLEGTAFPTWRGNSVITAHVYDAYGLPGPFNNLFTLKWGNEVSIFLDGQKYVYEVREVRKVTPFNLAPLKHEEYSWLTLITCQGYNELTDSYKYRLAVRAVLIRVEGTR